MAKKKLLLEATAGDGAQDTGGGEIGAAEAVYVERAGLRTPVEIAQELGVSSSRVMAVIGETCAVGVDVLARGTEEPVVLTMSGCEKICAVIDAEMARVALAPVVVAPVVPLPKTEDLRVTRIWGKKRVICNRTSNGREVVCRVQDSEHLMAGMVLPAAHAEADGIWSFYGKLPRRRGKW